jgi:shikimate dehydrogenase
MPEKYFSLGLVGYPLEHSVSPILHTTALKTSGLMGDYRLYPIEPMPAGEDKLRAVVQRLKSGQITGLNVTIPHKTAIIQQLDKLSPTANLIGAVNTIYLRSGQVFGDNTDAGGFKLDLERFINKSGSVDKVNNIPKQALVLGAGGAARAVVHSLIEIGWKVIIAARDPEKSSAIAHSVRNFGVENSITSIRLDSKSISSIKDLVNLIVNTTPAGMWPDVDSCAWPLELNFPTNGLVYDLVYKPRQTKLLNLARDQGLPAANGIGMLVEQAALAFELWTGISPSRDEMVRAINT